MKERTPFGTYCAQLRKKYQYTITEYAQKLGVSIGYVSFVEHGSKKIPSDWRTKIINIFNLNENEIKELNIAVIKSNGDLKITLDDIEFLVNTVVNNVFPDDGEDKRRFLYEFHDRINCLKLLNKKS